MLDLDAEAFREGQPLPPGWHFFLLGGETRRSLLRSDGFPGLGVELPDLGFERLVLGGRQIRYFGDIPIGARVVRESALTDYAERVSGTSAVVTISHKLTVASALAPAIVESQTYHLLRAGPRGPTKLQTKVAVTAERSRIVTPDQTTLFQYSALGFNSHKIHLDRHYAQESEGYPALVVNGGLITLFLTEFLRTDLEARPSNITTRHRKPLLCGEPITLTANRTTDGWSLAAHDGGGATATEMEAVIQ
jgi:3-methylfumaryl-CoA hydratase